MVGLAIGPLLVGLFSDSLAASYGAKSLNYALMTVCGTAAVIAAFSYVWTSRAMSSELDEGGEHVTDQGKSSA